MAWDILQGDSRQLAAGLPDNCLDAIVQDPPAGIDFLHKEWDGDKGGRDAWIAWLAAIMKEGFRAVKPGGWAVCWAIPRTSHWTAMALEDAGFEVRHVISHLFGSGFPHGLDIGKAMDRMRDDDIYHVTAFLAQARDAAGKTNPEIDQHFNYHGMAGHWTSSKSQPAVPTWENWLKLKEFLGFDDSLDAEVQKLNGRKGKPGDAWYERPILGWETDGVQGHVFSAAGAAPTYKTEFAITGHVSDEAHAWDGWNTALKPGAEHWIVARKLGAFADSYGAVVAELDRLEAELCNLNAPSAGKTTPLTRHGLSEGQESPVLPYVPIRSETETDLTTPTGGEDGEPAWMDTSSFPSMDRSALSIVSSWRGSLDALWTRTSRSTTETALALTTDLKTLRSCLEQITPDLLRESADNEEWCDSAVLAAGAVLSVMLRKGGTREPTAPESVTDRPGSEFVILAQKPLDARNYAANILKYGVGALNIAGCSVPRAEGKSEGWPANVVVSHSPACGEECHPSCPVAELDRQSGLTFGKGTPTIGGPPRTEFFGLAAGSGDRSASVMSYGDSGGVSRYYNQFAFGPEDLPSFFYCKKGSRQEKEAGVKEAGIEPVIMKRVNAGGLENETRFAPKLVYNDHPTVKSIALMRWLVRLVAPKGATVGDFFCGSGTTACAAILEGMNFIGFDLDARNVAISQARASYWSHLAEEAAEGGVPVLSLRSALPAAPKAARAGRPAPALTLGLFDEDEE